MKQKAIPLERLNAKSYMWNNIAIEAIVAILLVIWFYTGISKLIGYRNFSVQMYNSPIFHDFSQIVTFGAPLLEISLAILLIIRKTRIIGMIGSFLLMLFFTGYVIYLMEYLPTLPCSCGGIVSFLNWPQHLTLNIVLTILSLIGVFLIRKINRMQLSHISGSIA